MYLFFLQEPYQVTSNSFAITCIYVSLTELHERKHIPPSLIIQKSMVAFDFLKCVTRKIVTREFVFAHICARMRPEVFDDLSGTWAYDTICLLQVVRRYNNCPKTDTTQLLWQFDPRKAACAQYMCFSSFFYSTFSIRYTLMGAF